jgi:hypothetical protein
MEIDDDEYPPTDQGSYPDLDGDEEDHANARGPWQTTKLRLPIIKNILECRSTFEGK